MYNFSVRRVKQNKHDQIEEDEGRQSILRFSQTAAETQSHTWGVRFGKNASQSFTISKMKLLKTKHLSENTNTNDVCNAKSLHFNFFLKFHSSHADNIICNQKKCKIKVFSLMICCIWYSREVFVIMLTPTLIYNMFWPKLNATVVVGVRARVLHRSSLIDFRESAPLWAQHYDKALSSFWLSLPKSFLGLNAKKSMQRKVSLIRNKCLMDGPLDILLYYWCVALRNAHKWRKNLCQI